MKHIKTILATLSLGMALSAPAAEIVWTNTADGNWHTAANWSPNQVPGSGDTALITNGGNYTVTISSDARVAGIVVGGETATQTVSLASATLTLGGPLTINPHGVLAWNSGIIRNGTCALAGRLEWQAGYLRECDLTVSPGGIVNLSGDGTRALLHATLNNGGTVHWTDSGSFGAISIGSDLLAAVTNLAGGVFDLQTDTSFFYDSSGGFHFPFVFHNAGTLRKSAGTGTNVFIQRLTFENMGQVTLDQGAFRFEGGFTNNGAFQLAANTTAHLAKAANLGLATYGFGPSSLKTGDGTMLISSTTVSLLGTVPSLHWTDGTLLDSDFTVAANATLTLSGDSSKVMKHTTLRNAGHVLWTGGGNWVAYAVASDSRDIMVTNLAGGVFEIQTDADLTYDNSGGFDFAFVFHNAGTLRKTAGAGETVLVGTSRLTLVNTGTITVEQGSLVFPTFDNEGALVILDGSASFPVSLYNNGVLSLAANMVINLAGGAVSFGPDSQVTGEGQLAIPSGDVTLNGTVGNLLWTGGRLVNSTLTIATNGTLTIEGNSEKGMVWSTLNNAGTVNWTGTGNLRATSAGTNSTVLITNLPGAVFDLQTDADLLYDSGGGFHFLCAFDNQGTLRKSDGTGECLFPSECHFSSGGVMDIQTGTLNIGHASARLGGTLNFGLTSPTVFGRLAVSSTADLRGILRATLVNASGLSAGDSFAVLNRGRGLSGSVVFTGRNLGGGLVYDAAFDSSALTLVLRAATHPTPPVISLSYAPQLPAFVLMEGPVGPGYRLQASTNLTTWTGLDTNAAPAGVWEFSDPDAPSFSKRFYRGLAQ